MPISHPPPAWSPLGFCRRSNPSATLRKDPAGNAISLVCGFPDS